RREASGKLTRLRSFLFRGASVLWLLTIATRATVLAADHAGRVVFGSVPMPGVSVTAVRGDVPKTTATDEQGAYRLADLAEGVWSLRVEMLGFATIAESVTVGGDAPAPTWQLKLLPFDEITRGLPPPSRSEAPEPPRATPLAGRASGGSASAAAPASGF